MLFRQPYCAKALWSNSYFEHRFFNHSHLHLNFKVNDFVFEGVNLINYIVLHALHLVLVIHDWLLLFSSCIITMDHILIKLTILTNHVQITHNEFSKQQCINQVELHDFSTGVRTVYLISHF